MLNTIAVASSREDAWIETIACNCQKETEASRPPARTRGLKLLPLEFKAPENRRVLPRGRVD